MRSPIGPDGLRCPHRRPQCKDIAPPAAAVRLPTDGHGISPAVHSRGDAERECVHELSILADLSQSRQRISLVAYDGAAAARILPGAWAWLVHVASENRRSWLDAVYGAHGARGQHPGRPDGSW